MIKARLQRTDGKPIVFLGLTWENVAALREGKPIHVNLAEMGLDGEVIVHYAHDAAAIMEDLRKISPDLPSVPDVGPGETARWAPR